MTRPTLQLARITRGVLPALRGHGPGSIAPGAGDARASPGRGACHPVGAWALGVAWLAGAALGQESWPQFAAGAERTSRVDGLFAHADLAMPALVLSRDSAGRAITFIGQATPIATPDDVLAIGSVVIDAQPAWRLFAFDRRTGAPRWAGAIDAPVLGSWASPAFDRRNRRVVVPSGSRLVCLEAGTGAPAWETALARPIVNASPLVTDDLGPRDRCLITDYDGVGASGLLYCVNIDPYHAGDNPHQPGDVVWWAALGGTSGNTPAYSRRLGLVFVATAGEFGVGPGRVLAFPIGGGGAGPLWAVENPVEEAFFGGVAVRDGPGGAFVYAASYAFFGGTESANLLKIDALTGAVAWSAPCNRTASAPVPLPDGRVALSTGVQGYGTVPALQVFSATGQMAWDSSIATWNDLNQNGRRDPGEFLAMGGWAHQPALATGDLGTRAITLYVGESPAGSPGPAAGARLHAIDVGALAGGAWLRGASGFAGGAASLADRNLYSVGPTGLHVFGPPPMRCDVDGDGEVTVDDLHAWHAGAGPRDVNLDGVVDLRDADALSERLRRDERSDMRLGRPEHRP
ncbi:MAG: hypothetical protein FJ255_04810 [Phycisphaerae bacterium]|nr:hypothetical protein [Phycisphaerae bacterium]